MEEKEKEKEKEKKDGDFSLIDKCLKEKLIQKMKDRSPTSSEELHLFCEETVDMLPLPMNRQNDDNAKVYLMTRWVFYNQYFSNI